VQVKNIWKNRQAIVTFVLFLPQNFRCTNKILQTAYLQTKIRYRNFNKEAYLQKNIAEAIGVNKSIISRELKRNSGPNT